MCLPGTGVGAVRPMPHAFGRWVRGRWQQIIHISLKSLLLDEDLIGCPHGLEHIFDWVADQPADW